MNAKELIFGGGVKDAAGGGAAWRDSIQAWLPIKNILGGVAVTKDNRFVKILEVLPVNIYLKSASEALRHRFFLVFQYEARMRAKASTVAAILQRLNEEADTARRYLDVCELEVLEPRYSDDFVLKLLYEIINKRTGLRVKLPDGVFDMTTAVHGIYEE